MDHVAQRPLFALGLRLGAAVAVATMLMLSKLAAESGVKLPEVIFWRQAVTLPLILSYLAATGGLLRLRTGRIKSHAARAVMGMLAMLCTFAGVALLPLAEATTLSFTAPMFAVLISSVFLGQRVGRWRWLAVMLGFAGVIVIARPGLAPVNTLGMLAALGAGLLVTITSFQIRDLGRTEEPICTTFYFALFGCALAALALPFTMTAHNTTEWLMLLGVGVTGTIGQLLMSAALRWGSVTSVMVMDYTLLIWATLYGWLIWDRLPPLSLAMGAPLIVGAGLLIARREQLLARGKPVAPLSA